MMSALGLFSFSFLRRLGIACVIVTIIGASVLSLGDKAGNQVFKQRTVVHIDDGVLAPVKPASPANYLLIGHDATGHSDTMMVIHVDPAEPVPLLVSFPRDLIVEVPGHGHQMLNNAIALGGISLLVETFKSYFNVPINHILQVDFESFPQIVSAIGGHVSVYFPTPVHDPYIGLNIEQAGCVSLDPQMALAYARSRHYYVPDDIQNPAPWVWDYPAQRGGHGWSASGEDPDRIPRQQYFLRTLAQAAITKTDDNPLKLFGLVPAVMSHLTTDQNLKLSELKSLVNTFRKLKPADIEMTTIPWAPDPSDGNRLIVKYPDADSLLLQLASFKPVKPFLPGLVNPKTIRVRVVNGSGIAGLGARALSQLVAAGFTSAGPAVDADRSNYAKSQIRWAADADTKAVTAAYETYAVPVGQVKKASDTLGGDVLLIVGRDWNSLPHRFTKPATATTTPAGVTTTTAPNAPATTTTTTVDPAKTYQPVDPKTGGVLVGCPKT